MSGCPKNLLTDGAISRSYRLQERTGTHTFTYTVYYHGLNMIFFFLDVCCDVFRWFVQRNYRSKRKWKKYCDFSRFLGVFCRRKVFGYPPQRCAVQNSLPPLSCRKLGIFCRQPTSRSLLCPQMIYHIPEITYFFSSCLK